MKCLISTMVVYRKCHLHHLCLMSPFPSEPGFASSTWFLASLILEKNPWHKWYVIFLQVPFLSPSKQCQSIVKRKYRLFIIVIIIIRARIIVTLSWRMLQWHNIWDYYHRFITYYISHQKMPWTEMFWVRVNGSSLKLFWMFPSYLALFIGRNKCVALGVHFVCCVAWQWQSTLSLVETWCACIRDSRVEWHISNSHQMATCCSQEAERSIKIV